MSEKFLWWVGIDWATQAHQVCVIDNQRNIRLERSVAHTGSAIAQLADDLLALAGGKANEIAVSIETPRGAIIETLLDRGMVVFSINPKQLDRFRDRHTVAGAKDDRRDAFVLSDSLRTDTPLFARVRLRGRNIVQLRERLRVHEDLGQEVNALGSRLREQLHRYYPQTLELGSPYRETWFWALLDLAPTPEQAGRLNVDAVTGLLKQHHIRRLTAEKVIEILSVPPLVVAPGVVEASQEHVALLLPRLRLAYSQRQTCKAQIEVLLSELSAPVLVHGKAQPSDVAILLSMPGVGTVVAATLMAEAGPLIAERDLGRFRLQCGVGPVTRQSGKKKVVVRRWACNHRLQEAVFHWARTSVQCNLCLQTLYARQRQAGHSYGRALRGVGDRLATVLFAMLRKRELFEPEHQQKPTSGCR
jgi:transposase